MKATQLFKQFILLFGIAIFGFVSSSIAQNVLPLPTHKSVYRFDARGYWFVAPKNFIITGLRVPTLAGDGTQNIQVFKINGAIALYPSFGTNMTNLTYIKGAPNGIIQNVNLLILAGDTIGVFGSAGLDCSYSDTITPFTSTILGQPVILNRLSHYGDIDVNPALDYSGDVSGSMGRIELYYKCIPPNAENIVAEQVSSSAFNFTLFNKQFVDSVQWDFGDGTPRASGATTAHTYTSSGSYVVQAILKNNCDSTILLKAVTCFTTEIDKNELNNESVLLYPNPATNILTIKTENALTLKGIIIYNILGQKLYEGSNQNQNQYDINIAYLSSGIYSVYIQTDKSLMIRKLLVRK